MSNPKRDSRLYNSRLAKLEALAASLDSKSDRLRDEADSLYGNAAKREKASMIKAESVACSKKAIKVRKQIEELKNEHIEAHDSDELLTISHVTKIFSPGTVNEKVALEDINLTVHEGDVICVIGSNGSGKSTLFNMIAGTFPVTSGRIVLAGKDITRQQEFKRAYEIGRVFQDPTKGTSANMAIEDNMMLASKKGMRGIKYTLNSKTREKYKELLKPIHLDQRLKDSVGLLSGGQRQALTLLMTTLSKPHLLLLDEHTAALDPGNAQIVMDLTKEYIEKDKLTAMMITHNMQFAIDYGNRLIMMHEGHIILDIAGEEKKNLTVKDLVERFKEISKTEFTSDEGLLTT